MIYSTSRRLEELIRLCPYPLVVADLEPPQLFLTIQKSPWRVHGQPFAQHTLHDSGLALLCLFISRFVAGDELTEFDVAGVVDHSAPHTEQYVILARMEDVGDHWIFVCSPEEEK